jgi:hypothetical protein
MQKRLVRRHAAEQRHELALFHAFPEAKEV